MTLPVYCLALENPFFEATKVTVLRALTAMPKTSPVSTSKPEGTSTAKTGFLLLFISEITSAASRILPAKASGISP